MINLSRPEIVSTLPVVGPTLACLSSTLSSSNVQSVVQQGIKYTNGLKIPKVSLLQSVFTDPCRQNLDIDDCSEQWSVAVGIHCIHINKQLAQSYFFGVVGIIDRCQ